MSVERKRLDVLFAHGIQVLEEMFSASKGYHQELDRRLTQLPESIAKAISPEAIAGSINESLRQQFVKSTIPQTSDALTRIGADMRAAGAQFRRTAEYLGAAYDGAAVDASRAIAEIEMSITKASEAARHAASDLSMTYREGYRWSLHWFASVALVVGFVLGMLVYQLFSSPPKPVESQNTPQVAQPGTKISVPETPKNRR